MLFINTQIAHRKKKKGFRNYAEIKVKILLGCPMNSSLCIRWLNEFELA